MAIPTVDKVRALSADVGSQRKVAEMLGVNPSRVTRWIDGEGIDQANADRVDLLELVFSRLGRLYDADTVTRWLVGMNPRLGDRRPIDLIRGGALHEVLDAIAQEQSGAYA